MENKTKQIVFVKSKVAELQEFDIVEPKDNEAVVKLDYSAISSGTEKANLIGLKSDATPPKEGESAVFPSYLGYSGAGTIVKVGSKVTGIQVGDRVAVYGGKHRRFGTYNEKWFVKIPDGVSAQEAAFSYISTFSLAALRKTKVEFGESVVVMGLGLLGQFACKFAHAMGAYPVIAVDIVEERRNDALRFGADYAISPLDDEYANKIKEWTNGGAKVGIEVTGVGKGLEQILDCMAPFGRVALLGCTRNSDFSIDFYHKVHMVGVTLVGAHTLARPEQSYPNYWTYVDDIKAVLNALKGGRISFKDMIKEIHTPEECTEVYKRLAEEKNFPIGVLFDWTKE